MTHVTCMLTAKNRDQFRNRTLGNGCGLVNKIIEQINKHMGQFDPRKLLIISNVGGLDSAIGLHLPIQFISVALHSGLKSLQSAGQSAVSVLSHWEYALLLFIYDENRTKVHNEIKETKDI